jgi:DNA-directed RNA polymerase specialized sigma24 family protein
MAEFKTETDRIIKMEADRTVVMKHIVSTYQSVLYSLVLYLAKHEQDAEDILSEAFIKIYGSLHKYSINTNFIAWARRITVNVFLDK